MRSSPVIFILAFDNMIERHDAKESFYSSHKSRNLLKHSLWKWATSIKRSMFLISGILGHSNVPCSIPSICLMASLVGHWDLCSYAKTCTCVPCKHTRNGLILDHYQTMLLVVFLYWPSLLIIHIKTSQITRFTEPTWGPSGADRTQVGPMLAPWILLSGMI